MTIPPWALTLSFWLHMLATVVWVGGLATVNLLIVPAAQQLDDPSEGASLLARVQRRLDPLGWFSLILLVGTGLVQMDANPNYEGFLAFENDWAVAILLKHIVFLGMIGVSAYLTWGITPTLQRALLRRSRGLEAPVETLQKRSLYFLRLNLGLGIVVLVFTAIARAAA